MSKLIGCTFDGPEQGWRIRACRDNPNPQAGVQKKAVLLDGMLWVPSPQSLRPGRYVNPAALFDRVLKAPDNPITDATEAVVDPDEEIFDGESPGMGF